MLQETKKFIQASAKNQNLDSETAKFLLTNKIGQTIMNISKAKKGYVRFLELRNFHQVIENFLTPEQLACFDLFCDFNNAKNAINCILDAIESNTQITYDTFNNQSKITAKDWSKFKGIITYADFYGNLTEEQQKSFESIAHNWLDFFHNGKSTFEFFQINDGTFKAGDYVIGYDPTYSNQFFTRIFQASPNGFITALDDKGYFTLSSVSAPKVVKSEMIPAEIREKLDETFAKFEEEVEIYRNDVIAKEIAKAERLEAQEAKEMARQEREAKKAKELEAKNKEREEVFLHLQKIKLDTPEKIKDMATKLNASNLSKEQMEKMRAKVRKAKEKLGIAQSKPSKRPTATTSTKSERLEATATGKPKAIYEFNADDEQPEATTATEPEAPKKAPRKAKATAK